MAIGPCPGRVGRIQAGRKVPGHPHGPAHQGGDHDGGGACGPVDADGLRLALGRNEVHDHGLAGRLADLAQAGKEERHGHRRHHGGGRQDARQRQGARSLTQIELLPEPPKDRPPDDPWPTWPTILRTSSSHEEGCDRLWSVLTKEFLGLGTRVRGLRCVRIAWSEPDAAPGAPGFHEVPDSEFRLEADLVILALGFVHAEAGPLVRDLGIDLDPRGNLRVDEEFRTSASGVFAAGDAVAGASLVVRAIDQGRRVAEAVDRFLRSA